MSNWVWLSRVTLFGLAGTAALATFFFAILNLPGTRNSEADRIRATAVTAEEIQAVKLPIQPLPPPINRNQRSQQFGGAMTVRSRPFDLKQTLTTYSPLFATPTSLGMVAIGVAEGNYRLVVQDGTLYVQQTPTYFGHTDPGNLSWGERVTNYGPCSDQGRSRGNIALAEQFCLERALSRLPTHLVDLNAAGIDLNQDVEAVLNTADLYNQASPINSRYFPKALAIARRGGLTGIEALAWARTASFYLNSNDEMDVENGTNQATGLLGICIREGRPITEWQCVYDDQMRRVQAIATVVEKYRRLAQQGAKNSTEG
jgi:hypothetical protein